VCYVNMYLAIKSEFKRMKIHMRDMVLYCMFLLMLRLTIDANEFVSHLFHTTFLQSCVYVYASISSRLPRTYDIISSPTVDCELRTNVCPMHTVFVFVCIRFV
jgi:hypothetical protein